MTHCFAFDSIDWPAHCWAEEWLAMQNTPAFFWHPASSWRPCRGHKWQVRIALVVVQQVENTEWAEQVIGGVGRDETMGSHAQLWLIPGPRCQDPQSKEKEEKPGGQTSSENFKEERVRPQQIPEMEMILMLTMQFFHQENTAFPNNGCFAN